MDKHRNNEWNRVVAFGNLLSAFKKAARRKRSKETVAAFEYHLEPNLFQIQAELKSGSYRPGRYVRFAIQEGKRRLISAAPFR